MTTPFVYNLLPGTTRALVSTAYGGTYFEDWTSRTFHTWKRYVEAHDIAIIVLRDRIDTSVHSLAKNAAWDKLLAPELVASIYPQITEVCLIDTDIVIGPTAPNIFDHTTPGAYAVVSQENGLPFPIDLVRRRVALLRKRFYDPDFPLDSILQATPEKVFASQGLPIHHDYFCSGLIVLDSTKFADLADCYRSVPDHVAVQSIAWEEPFVNDWIQSREHVWLAYDFQAIWLFEMAWSYPHLYGYRNELSANLECVDAVTATMWNRSFLHFAGSWFESMAWEALGMEGSTLDAALEADWRQVLRHKYSGIPRGKILPTGNI